MLLLEFDKLVSACAEATRSVIQMLTIFAIAFFARSSSCLDSAPCTWFIGQRLQSHWAFRLIKIMQAKAGMHARLLFRCKPAGMTG